MGNLNAEPNPAAIPGIIKSQNPPNVIALRAPTSADRRYKIGTLWIDKANNASYQLTSVVAGSANWEVLGSATGAVATITGDSGGALSPSGGNINIIGTAADGLAFAGSGSTLTGSISAASTSQRGTLELLTNAEALTGTDSSRAVTADNLSYLKTATDITWTQSPVLQSLANTGVAPTGATGDVNLMMSQEGEVMEQFILGAGQTIIAPRMDTSGLLVSLDLTNNEGAEYNWGARANAKHAYTIGTSPAFYLEWRFTLADVTGCDPVGIGFRKQEANNAALASYTDFAWIGVSESDNSALISLKTRLNSGAVTTTDTTDAWADGETHTLAVLVDGSGNVTYTIDGVAPSVTAAFQFDSGDVVMPFWRGLHGATAPGAWHWVYAKAGVQ